MNVLSLFSGIGGLELGLERAGMTVVGQVEIDEYCRRVLAKHWPEVPRHDDVRTAVEWWQSEPRPRVDVVCGGFPCQDISNAGRRAGIGGTRSGLWSYTADAVRVLRPHYVVMENVSAILVRGLDVVTADLAACGYDVQWDCIPAASVGAPHRRDRWWGIAYANDEGRSRSPELPAGRDTVRRAGSLRTDVDRPGDEDLAHAASVGRRQGWSRGSAGGSKDGQAERPEALADTVSVARATGVPRAVFAGSSPRGSVSRTDGRGGPVGGNWSTEPDVGRVAHGIPNRVDRLRALGNAVVPQAAEHIGRLLMDFDAKQVAA